MSTEATTVPNAGPEDNTKAPKEPVAEVPKGGAPEVNPKDASEFGLDDGHTDAPAGQPEDNSDSVDTKKRAPVDAAKSKQATANEDGFSNSPDNHAEDKSASNDDTEKSAPIDTSKPKEATANEEQSTNSLDNNADDKSASSVNTEESAPIDAYKSKEATANEDGFTNSLDNHAEDKSAPGVNTEKSAPVDTSKPKEGNANEDGSTNSPDKKPLFLNGSIKVKRRSEIDRSTDYLEKLKGKHDENEVPRSGQVSDMLKAYKRSLEGDVEGLSPDQKKKEGASKDRPIGSREWNIKHRTLKRPLNRTSSLLDMTPEKSMLIANACM